MTSKYGCGLDGLMRLRKDHLYGIPNGVDYSVWSPRNDHYLKKNYDIDSLENKKECKKDLIEETRLSIEADSPVIGFVGRLVYQKGVDLLSGVIPALVNSGAGIVILGRGEKDYEETFRALADRYPGNVHVCNDFNDALAHKIEAGSDIFVMPSRYEPCGLNQMYSIKYGTVPVVRATGGLDDVIIDYDQDSDRGNGFKFGPSSPEALLSTLERAITLYHDKTVWVNIMKQGMKADFSWTRSAEEYLKLYRNIII
jgi:starch synthase